MTLQDLLDARALPAVDFPATATGWWHRHMELQQLLCHEAYGQLPPLPSHLSVREVLVDERFCAGNAPLRQLRLTVTLPGGQHTFPVSLAVPKNRKACPLVIYISFRPNMPTNTSRWRRSVTGAGRWLPSVIKTLRLTTAIFRTALPAPCRWTARSPTLPES